MKSFRSAKNEHAAKANKYLRSKGYESMASTERREATPVARAKGGRVHGGKRPNKTQINILMGHEGNAGPTPVPVPVPAPAPARPMPPPMAAGLGARPPMPVPAGPMPPRPVKRGGRVK